MSKTPTKTSPSKTPKKQTPTRSVEDEFSYRVLGLMTSFYELTNFNEYLGFPNYENQTTEQNDKTQEKSYPFNSTITDLRVKKVYDSKDQVNETYNQHIEEMITEFNNDKQENYDDLHLAFMPEQAERPEVPLYMINQQKDLEAFKTKRNPVKLLNVTDIESEMKPRLEKSKQRGIERSRQRVMRLWKRMPAKKDEVSLIHPPWRGLNQNYGALMTYHPENGYPHERVQKNTPSKVSYYPE